MGEQVKELFSWARRRKTLATFFVVLTLGIGILIGSIVSGRTSAMKSFGFGGTTATPLAVPDPIPATNSFSSIVNRVEPAVVNIATTQVMERRQTRKRRTQPNDQDDPMKEILHRIILIVWLRPALPRLPTFHHLRRRNIHYRGFHAIDDR